MDVCLVIKDRLEKLGFEQRDLAAAAKVTESYISQLLTRKKLPPASDRTDIYEKMGKFLKLSSGKLAKLADITAQGSVEEGFRGSTCALVCRSSSVGSAQVRAGKAATNTSDFREAGLRRTRTPRHAEASGRVQASRQRTELRSEKWLHMVAQI